MVSPSKIFYKIKTKCPNIGKMWCNRGLRANWAGYAWERVKFKTGLVHISVLLAGVQIQ
jgi:hypothetical protein